MSCPRRSGSIVSGFQLLRLEVDRQDEVDLALRASDGIDAAKVRCIKGDIVESETRVVERIDKVSFEFHVGFLEEARRLRQADVDLREVRAVYQVAREVAERAW